MKNNDSQVSLLNLKLELFHHVKKTFTTISNSKTSKPVSLSIIFGLSATLQLVALISSTQKTLMLQSLKLFLKCVDYFPQGTHPPSPISADWLRK